MECYRSVGGKENVGKVKRRRMLGIGETWDESDRRLRVVIVRDVQRLTRWDWFSSKGRMCIC